MAFVVPAFEARMAEGLPASSELIAWEEHEDPYAAVAEAGRRLGVASGTILLDDHSWIETQTRLAGAMPGVRFRPDPGVIESVRIKKSPEEIEAIRAACNDAGKTYLMVAKRLLPGISERELNRHVSSHLDKAGLQSWGSLIQGGETASVPHRPSGSRVFQDGDAVIVDLV